MTDDCIFCRIVQKTIPAKIEYEDDHYLAFHDIHPKAPVHLLIIPKTHIATLNDTAKEVVADMIDIAKKLAKKFNVAEDGYRVLINCNQAGGQIVYHVHLHLLAGRQLH